MIQSREDIEFLIGIAFFLFGVLVLSVAFSGYSYRGNEKQARIIQRALFVIAIIFTVLWIIARTSAKESEAEAYADFFFLPAGICFLLWVFVVLGKVCSGYRFQNDILIYRRLFFRKSVSSKDIGNIVISTRRNRYHVLSGKKANYWRNLETWPYPFITLESVETAQILTRERTYPWEVTDYEVWEYSKGYNHYIYGFLYDPNNPPDMLFQNHTGRVYITYSILALYIDEFLTFFDEHNISKDQVAIIRDRSTYRYFPREIDEAYVDQRIREW